MTEDVDSTFVLAMSSPPNKVKHKWQILSCLYEPISLVLVPSNGTVEESV